MAYLNRVLFVTNKEILKKLLLVVSLLGFISLSGCGGGGAGSGSSTNKEAPVITLIGDNPTYIPVGGSYTDLGAKAKDKQDGEFSATATGTVNTSVAGSYTITYSAKDSDGNSASTITRTVKVEPPSDAGSNNLEVIDGKLEMKTVINGGKSVYFINTENDRNNLLSKINNKFISIEGHINLLGAKTTGSRARSRLYLIIIMKSISRPDQKMSLQIIFDQRASLVSSRAYMNRTGRSEVAISEINALSLSKGTAVQFKIELLEDAMNFAKLTIGDKSTVIPLSEALASDMTFVKGGFKAYAGGGSGVQDFVKGNIDNVIVKYKEKNSLRIYIQNFDGYRNGRIPKKDNLFN